MSINPKVESALNKYKAGKHIHFGNYNDHEKSVEERMEENELNGKIMEAVIKYELERGGLVIENGIFKKTDKCGLLPCQRDDATIMCCVENEENATE